MTSRACFANGGACFPLHAWSGAGGEADDAVGFWDMTNRQDWYVCELSQQGVSSRAYEPGPYAELESLLAAFDREYLRAMGEAIVEPS